MLSMSGPPLTVRGGTGLKSRSRARQALSSATPESSAGSPSVMAVRFCPAKTLDRMRKPDG